LFIFLAALTIFLILNVDPNKLEVVDNEITLVFLVIDFINAFSVGLLSLSFA
jgi:hypothetical protein